MGVLIGLLGGVLVGELRFCISMVFGSFVVMRFFRVMCCCRVFVVEYLEYETGF